MADVFVKHYVLYLYQLREIVTEYYRKSYYLLSLKSLLTNAEVVSKYYYPVQDSRLRCTGCSTKVYTLIHQGVQDNFTESGL